MECEGIGPERAESIAEWFADEDNPRARRRAARRSACASRPATRTGRSRGRSPASQYVITGTLESLSREQARAALEALGAKVSDGVSKKTTGVFVGESPGSKVTKAEKAGVPLLSEARPRGAARRASPTDASALATRSCASRAARDDTGSPFWRIANANRSPRSPRARRPRRSCRSSRARRRVPAVCSRCSSVPVTPATGSAAQKADAGRGRARPS